MESQTSALLPLRATVAVIGLLVIAAPADALIIRDQRNQTSGDGQGNSSPPGDYLLIRQKYLSGVCGDWMCCPANGDGSYNCDEAVNPTRSAISGALKNLLGPRATVLKPDKNPGTTRLVLPGMRAPTLHRGVGGEKVDSPVAHQSGKAVESK